MTVGLTNDHNLAGLNSHATVGLEAVTGGYGMPVGTVNRTGVFGATYTAGLTLDPTKSGIVADLSSGMSAVIKF